MPIVNDNVLEAIAVSNTKARISQRLMNESSSALQQGQSIVGVVTRVYGDFMDVEATNSDGSKYTIRQVYPSVGYARAGVGETVTVAKQVREKMKLRL